MYRGIEQITEGFNLQKAFIKDCVDKVDSFKNAQGEYNETGKETAEPLFQTHFSGTGTVNAEKKLLLRLTSDKSNEN